MPPQRFSLPRRMWDIIACSNSLQRVPSTSFHRNKRPACGPYSTNNSRNSQNSHVYVRICEASLFESIYICVYEQHCAFEFLFLSIAQPTTYSSKRKIIIGYE